MLSVHLLVLTGFVACYQGGPSETEDPSVLMLHDATRSIQLASSICAAVGLLGYDGSSFSLWFMLISARCRRSTLSLMLSSF